MDFDHCTFLLFEVDQAALFLLVDIDHDALFYWSTVDARRHLSDIIDAVDIHFTAFFISPIFRNSVYPPASKASREVANFNEKKKSTYPRIWCQRICLSVCLSVKNFDPIISGLAEQNGLKKKFRTFWAK